MPLAGPCHLGGVGVYHPPPPKEKKERAQLAERGPWKAGTSYILRNFLENWSEKVFKTKFKPPLCKLSVWKKLGDLPTPPSSPVFCGKIFWFLENCFFGGGSNGRGSKFFISPPPPPNHLARPWPLVYIYQCLDFYKINGKCYFCMFLDPKNRLIMWSVLYNFLKTISYSKSLNLKSNLTQK
jgi:hypothetical protein